MVGNGKEKVGEERMNDSRTFPRPRLWP